MENNINDMIAKSIQRGLKRKIKARIWVEIVDNEILKVSITAFGHTWEYSEPSIYHTVIDGNVMNLVHKIVRLYKGYMLNRYFVKDNSKDKEEKKCNA